MIKMHDMSAKRSCDFHIQSVYEFFNNEYHKGNGNIEEIRKIIAWLPSIRHFIIRDNNTETTTIAFIHNGECITLQSGLETQMCNFIKDEICGFDLCTKEV